MNLFEKAQRVREWFLKGSIPVEELLLHIEPILAETASDGSGQVDVRRIVNAIEKTIFTEKEPERSNMLAEQLAAVVAFIRTRTSA